MNTKTASRSSSYLIGISRGYKSCCLPLFVLLLFIANCTNSSDRTPAGSNQPSKGQEIKADLPDHVKDLENVAVYSFEDQTPMSVTFEKETVFESNEDVFFDGYSGEVIIDNEDNVYIVVSKPGTVGVYKFDREGRFLEKFMNEGRGPGEVEAIGSIGITGDKIVVFGPRLQKLSIFSASDFSLLNDAVIRKDKLEKSDIISSMRVHDVFVINDSTMIAGLQSNMTSNEFRKRYLYKISEDGQLKPGKILEQERYRIYQTGMKRTSEGYILFPFSLPVNRNSLTAVSDRGNIYSAWTEDFLIKMYDIHGNYQRSIYYPYENVPVSLTDLDIIEDRRQFLSNDNVPDTWPALHTMFVDDEERLWVATITDSDSTYNWQVLDSDGALLASFRRKGSKNDRSAMWQPFYKVKNGFFYERERDVRNGIDRIIKYKIDFDNPTKEDLGN